MQTSQNVLTSLNVLTLVVEVFWYSVCSKYKDIHTHTLAHLAGFQSLRGGGISSLLLRGATPNAACMMVMNFLYFMFSIAVGQSVAMTAGVGPSSREMFPSGGAESKVLDRGDAAAAARGQMTRSNNKTAV